MLTACVEQTGFGRVGSRYFGGLLKALQEELWSGRQASCFTNTLEETHDLEENRRALNFDGAAIEIWTFSTSTILKKKNRQINQKGHIVCKSRAGCELKLHSYSKSFLHFIKTLNSASDASLTNTGSLQPPLSPPAPPSAAHISHKRIFGSGLLPFLGQSNVSFFLTLLGEGSPSLTTLKFRCRFDLVSHPVDQLFTSVSIPVLQMQPLYKAFQEFSLQFSTNKEANGHSHWKSSVGIPLLIHGA